MNANDQFIILYHPDCNPSKKLLSKIKDNNKFNCINVLDLVELPADLKCVPAGIKDDNIITGKSLFDEVDGMLSIVVKGFKQSTVKSKNVNFTSSNPTENLSLEELKAQRLLLGCP